MRVLEAPGRASTSGQRRERRERARRGDALVRLLPDIERELLEPVDCFRDLVDADDHATRPDLNPVQFEPHLPVSLTQRTDARMPTGEVNDTHLISSSSSSSLLGWRSPIPAGLAAFAASAPSAPPARIELRYASCRARSRSRKSEARPYRRMKRLLCGGRADWSEAMWVESVLFATCVERSCAVLRDEA